VIGSVPRASRKTLHSGFTELGSLRVHHTHGGRGSPVLFIHGLGSSGYIEWRFNLEAAAERHRVYAPDLPGFGRSEKPRARYGVPYFTRFIDRYMQARGLRSAAVVGTSLGGRIALELALEHPRRVSRLVLVNSLGFGRPKVHMSYGLVTIPGLGEAVMSMARDALHWAPSQLIRRVAGRLSGASHDLKRTMDDAYLDNLRELYSTEGYHDAYLATVRSLVTPKALFGGHHDVTERLNELKIPVQLIWGADDPLFPLSHADRAHSLIAGSRLAVIKGAGHTPQAERPEEFNRVLRRFLEA
jgi:pimeloyl-ACP methyl ester carboxylesterase